MGIPLVLILLLLICLNPFNFLMPPPVVKMLLVFLILIFGVFSVIIWKERSGDERENYHKMIAGHFSFIIGTTLLVLAITVQELKNSLDPWLIFILIAMIIAKIFSHIYSQNKH